MSQGGVPGPQSTEAWLIDAAQRLERERDEARERVVELEREVELLRTGCTNLAAELILAEHVLGRLRGNTSGTNSIGSRRLMTHGVDDPAQETRGPERSGQTGSDER